MQRYSAIFRLVALACALWFTLGEIAAPTAFAAGNGSAHLSVRRIANFGNGIAVVLYVDGAQVMTISRGRKYDGTLSPGRHVISATPVPNVMMSPMWTRTIDAQPGRNYFFTAKWQGTNLTLVLQ